MKQHFKSTNFRPASLQLIETCNEILEAYSEQGLKLTLRQLYYQCVTRNLFPNTERSYKNLGSLVSDGRLAGLIDWDAIEDRIRVPEVQSEWSDIESLVRSATRAYRLPRWKDQDYYVELWVEKDALAGVLSPLANKHHITLMVNRGYSSQSAMFDSAQRFIDNQDRQGILLYLGDHDPSGEDMVRDVRDRLSMFGAEVSVIKVALTTEQVKKYRPLPNPAKMSDSRAPAYVALHGRHSWELDAIEPPELQKIVERAITAYVDEDKMAAIIDREQVEVAKLTKAAARI